MCFDTRRRSDILAFLAVFLCIFCICSSGTVVCAHEGYHSDRNHLVSGRLPKRGGPGKGEANQYFRVFTSLLTKWPLSCREALIEQSAREHQFLHGDPMALDLNTLRLRRGEMMKKLTSLLPTFEVQVGKNGTKLFSPTKPVAVCPQMPTLVLVRFLNQTSKTIVVRSKSSFGNPAEARPISVRPDREVLMDFTVLVNELNGPSGKYEVQVESREGKVLDLISIPFKVVKPAKLKLRLIGGTGLNSEQVVPGRMTVQCSDGVCRHGGKYAGKSTFTDKPVIYPPIGTWQKLAFFYSDEPVEMEVPPGATRVTFERGFEHQRETVELSLKPGETMKVERDCKRIAHMPAQGWISGDTHVHWVTNAWNVDEPLELLAMAQRAEDLKVANNLTLLQRYENQAFVKPSQAAMGPVMKYSNAQFHIQMGEEYRNEDLYGHLCLLNIDWLVQPIGTGSIIAGPDALDYPINRTAIEACRIQGGISIEAHGTGGNKDVPVNVIHCLSDSLDQMEPEMYYRLLDCGFKIPLTNGSDHPARTLGVARAYVKVKGDFSYDRWIDGIRKGRTFTTSGPLIFLKVNGADIGDVILADDEEKLHVEAKVISRDPIGTVQIISNGKVLFSHETTKDRFETEFDIPAKESRWIVARCSRRKDGRAEFGFGNFNVITGPGVAHTSPVYVQVNGLPRFDSAAADYWRERMRMHTHDIRGRGRFADDSQRQEAVGYIEEGIEMFQDLKSQTKLARSATETVSQLGRRLANIVRRLGKSKSAQGLLGKIKQATTFDELKLAVEPITLLIGTVTPESQLIIKSISKRVELKQGRPQRFLVEIDNPAGTTGPLKIIAYDLEPETRKLVDRCSVEVVDSPFTSAFLTGATRELKVVEILARESGELQLGFAGKVGGQLSEVPKLTTRHETNARVTANVKGRNRRNTISPEK